MKRQTPKRVRLLREAGGMGDVVCCLPVLRWMHETHVLLGGGELYLYGFDPFRPLWEMSGVPFRWRNQHHNGARRRRRWVDPVTHYRERREEFSVSVDLWCPAWPHETSSEPNHPIWSRIECFAEAAGMPFDRIGCPQASAPEDARRWARQSLGFAGWKGEPLVLLFPYAMGPARCWGSERFASVARRLWREMGCRVMVLSGDTPGLRWWREHAPEFTTPRAPLSLPRLAALIELADLTLSGDTGPMHLAAALSTPSLGLFGMTGGALTCKHYSLARWIQGETERPGGCRVPCYHRYHDGYDNRCRHTGCAALASIQEDDVVAEAASMLQERRGHGKAAKTKRRVGVSSEA